jgi:hypothetical protein
MAPEGKVCKAHSEPGKFKRGISFLGNKVRRYKDRFGGGAEDGVMPIRETPKSAIKTGAKNILTDKDVIGEGLRVQDSRYFPALLEFIKYYESNMSPVDLEHHLSGAKNLGEIGAREGFPRLLKAATAPGVEIGSREMHVYLRAMEKIREKCHGDIPKNELAALGELDSKESRFIIAEGMKLEAAPDAEKADIVRKLGEIASLKCIPPLMRALETGTGELAYGVLFALHQIAEESGGAVSDLDFAGPNAKNAANLRALKSAIEESKDEIATISLWTYCALVRPDDWISYTSRLLEPERRKSSPVANPGVYDALMYAETDIGADEFGGPQKG